MTSSCGCGHDAEDFAQVDVLADEDQLDTMPDPRGDKVTVWSGLIAPIGVETGDGRKFGNNALSHRDLPLPLRWHREDEGGHKRAVVVGTIDDVEYRADGVYATGVLLDPDPAQMPRLAEDVAEARLLLEKGAIGPSVDLDEMEYSVAEQPEGADPNARPKIDVNKGRISAATLVQIPAFAETRGIEMRQVDAVAYAASRAVMASAAGGWEEVVSVPGWTPNYMGGTVDDLLLGERTFAVQTPEGQGYYPVRAVVDGRLVVVREAVEFANRALNFGAPAGITDEQVADMRSRFRAWLTQPVDQVADDEDEMGDAMVASAATAAPVRPPAEWFHNPELTEPTPLTITEDGRVYGHLATWRTCHTGFAGSCVTAPKSRTQYAYFHTGEVLTAEGAALGVGRITLGGGHADIKLGFQAAIEHYDNAGTCAALVRAGEDKHGIWLAGALAPEVTELQAAALRRHPPSGDWRRIGGSLELVGALAVNTPGFPVPRSRVASGAPQALVAAGALTVDSEPEDLTTAVRYAVSEALRADRRARAAAVAFAEAEQAEEGTQRAARRVAAAGVFAMPDFIKKKIEARKEDEPECDDDDEDCKKKKAAKGKPFGGKKAPPFGSK